MIAALAVLCWLSWINAVITHNVIHLPLWRSPALNKITRAILSLTYGFPVSDYVPGHNLSHHRYLQSRRDVMRTTKVRLSWNPGQHPHVLPDGRGRRHAREREVRRLREGHAVRLVHRAQRPDEVLTWGVKIALLLVDWKKALLFVFVPHLGAVWGVTTVNYLWHDGCDALHRYNHSRNFIGKFFNWFHFNNGFHAMHHLEAGLHWSLLPERHAALIAPHIHPALEQKSLLVYLVRTFVLERRRLRYDGAPVVLPEEGADEDWIGSGRRRPSRRPHPLSG